MKKNVQILIFLMSSIIYSQEYSKAKIREYVDKLVELSVNLNDFDLTSIGKSKLKAYFSEKYGFIKLDYTLFNGIKIDLNLVKIIDGPILRDAKDFFENKYK